MLYSVYVKTTFEIEPMPIQFEIDSQKAEGLLNRLGKNRLILYGVSLIILITVILLVVNNDKSTEVLNAKGEVYLQTDSGKYIEINGDVEVLASGFLKTGNGEAKVIYPDKSVTNVGPNSEVYIDTNEGSRSIISSFMKSIKRILNIYKAPKDDNFGNDDVLSTVRG
ncbi:MAG: hypothetical protein Fur003_6350 [Candidatus Dojkabacteria bacterium]